MPMYIQTNISSLQAQNSLNSTHAKLGKHFDRLSSGFRINSAADDAAGLAISESMKSQIRSYGMAERNAGDAISMVQTAEAALGEVHGILNRMRELSIQSANGSLSSQDRDYINTEFGALKSEIGRIQSAAKFNGKELISATATTIQFQIGLNNTASDQLQVSFGGMGLTTLLAATSVVSGTGPTSALGMLSVIDNALTTVSTARSRYGASMNRLEIATAAIATMRTNLTAANSRIRDVNVAEETAALARNQVLSQAGVSVLAQANQLPQLALNLIGG